MTFSIRKSTIAVLVAVLANNCCWAWQYGSLSSERDGWREQAVSYAGMLIDKDRQLSDENRELARLRQQLSNVKAVDPQPMGMHIPHLRRTIRATLAHLRVAHAADWERLLLLTVLQESNAGAYTRQLKGPARGIVQIEPATEREVLAWAKRKQPVLYSSLRSLRMPARLGIHEAEVNTAYAVGVAYTLYLMRHADPRGKNAKQLAGIYKQKYNTAKGKATVPGVMQRLRAYAVNL